jgi:hypothetical protein
VQSNDLVVLDSVVRVLVALLVRDVHEESTRKSLADVLVVGLVLERRRNEVTIARSQ